MTDIADISQHPFCIFADQLYADAKLKEILRNLQQSLGINPNVILFCCWLAETGQQQFTQKEIHYILSSILHWHEQIVLALNEIRKNIASSKIKALILETETKANHLEQIMLTETIIKPRQQRSMLQKFSDAYKNINGYCKVMKLSMNKEDADMVTNLLTIIFPT